MRVSPAELGVYRLLIIECNCIADKTCIGIIGIDRNLCGMGHVAGDDTWSTGARPDKEIIWTIRVKTAVRVDISI